VVSLSDDQLKMLLDAAASLAADRRAVFLERVGAMLKILTMATCKKSRRLHCAALVHQRTDAA
jgi:hypothetical protein